MVLLTSLIQFAVILLSVCILCRSNATFIDPTDLFKTDEMNIELSKKTKRMDEANSDERKNLNDFHAEPKDSILDTASKDPPPEHSSFVMNDVSKSGTHTQVEQRDDEGKNDAMAACDVDDKQMEAVYTLFQQHIMRIVQLSQTKILQPRDQVEFCLRMKVSQNDLSVLKKFGEGDRSVLYAAHDKLSHMVQSVCDLPRTNTPRLWLEHHLGMSPAVLFQVIAALLIFLLILKTVASLCLTRSRIWALMVAVIIISVMFTWFEMYQKKLADNERVLIDSMQSRCPQYEKLNMWERFTHYLSSTVTFQNENCREFYEAVMISPIIQVSPLEALTMAIVKTVMSPMKIIGIGIKEFVIGLSKDLPVQYAMVLLVIIVIIVLYILLLIFGYTVRMPFFLTLEAPPAQPSMAVINGKIQETIDARQEIRYLEAVKAKEEEVRVQQVIKAREEVKIQEAIKARENHVKHIGLFRFKERHGKVHRPSRIEKREFEKTAFDEEDKLIYQQVCRAKEEVLKIQEEKDNFVSTDKELRLQDEIGQGDVPCKEYVVTHHSQAEIGQGDVSYLNAQQFEMKTSPTHPSYQTTPSKSSAPISMTNEIDISDGINLVKNKTERSEISHPSEGCHTKQTEINCSQLGLPSSSSDSLENLDVESFIHLDLDNNECMQRSVEPMQEENTSELQSDSDDNLPVYSDQHFGQQMESYNSDSLEKDLTNLDINRDA